VLRELIEAYDLQCDDRESHRVMTEAELLDLRASIEVGAHSLSHPLLPVLTADEQHKEIVGSRGELERLTGRRVRAFAYPYGARGAFTDETVETVEHAGYELACTGFEGVVTPRHHPYRLPRYFPMDWDTPEFSWRMAQWFDGH
jgi:peptidoglycan/xylan/chitin deacetylase (PgdA/CDA1 family)